MGMVVVCVRQQDRKSAERSMCADGPATRTRLVGLRMLSRIVVKVKKFRLQGITPCHAASGFKPWSCDHGEQPTTSNSASTGCADNNHDYYRVQDPRSSPNMFRPTLRRLAGGASHGKPLWEAKGADANHPVGKIYKQPFLYRFCATGIGASMWFFLMYRAKQDGPALLGLKHPWEH